MGTLIDKGASFDGIIISYVYSFYVDIGSSVHSDTCIVAKKALPNIKVGTRELIYYIRWSLHTYQRYRVHCNNPQYEMPGCVCWGSENVPIMMDASGKKNIPILKESSATKYP